MIVSIIFINNLGIYVYEKKLSLEELLSLVLNCTQLICILSEDTLGNKVEKKLTSTYIIIFVNTSFNKIMIMN